MKILVTGSSGFIGKAVAQHLVLSGYEVIGLHARASPDADSKVGRDVIADVASSEDVARLCQEVGPCDAIVHAAASLDMSLHAPEISRVNCMGTQNMLNLLSQWRGKQFVFLSSLPVIGVPQILPITEEHPVKPLTAYHASKLFGEQIVRLAEKPGVTTMSLRLTAPVGPHMPKNRLLSVFVRRALSNKPLEISGRGTRKQNYVDVRDIARATELCLQGKTSGIFNIASDKSISNMDLASYCISRCISSSAIVFNGRDDPEEKFAWDVSIQKARTELGYMPKYDLSDAVDAVVEELGDDVRKAA